MHAHNIFNICLLLKIRKESAILKTEWIDFVFLTDSEYMLNFV